jgi:two-component system CheB/CheR fusion protein
LNNLLNNAAKYTEPGGTIWLNIEHDEDEVVFRVRDTGIGIPPEMLPRVFELFTQVDQSLDRRCGGLGIGLPLVRKLAEMHNGTVQGFSAGRGAGSEFVLRLPLAVEQLPANLETGSSVESNSVPQRRVLVVDDHEDVAECLAMLLQDLGHLVHTVHDGPAAFEAVRTFEPEVVLLDIGLPEMDGYEVARRLRAEHGRDNLLLIALTGYGQEADRRRTAEAGFDEHLLKPAGCADLNRLLAGPLVTRC